MPNVTPPDKAIIEEMWKELRAGDKVFLPSKLWEKACAYNLMQLELYGMERFKRTVNQNYFNVIPTVDYNAGPVNVLLNYWLENPRPLKAEIGGVDFIMGFFQQNPFQQQRYRNYYRLFVNLLWNYVTDHDLDGLTEKLCEPELGDPIPVRLEERMISQDIANSILERNFVHAQLRSLTLGKPVIAELGAGYGRVGDIFLSTQPCRYMVFDIPPALYVSQWYLSNRHPDKRTFAFRRFEDFADVREEVERADICFFTPNQLASIPAEYFDAFIAIDNLQEMTLEQISRYKELMSEKTRYVTYLKNSRDWTNVDDGITVGTDLYRLNGDWANVVEEVDPILGNYVNLVYRKQ